MKIWLFLAVVCMTIGQLIHSWPLDTQRIRPYLLLAKKASTPGAWLSWDQQLRSIGNDDTFQRRSETGSYEKNVWQLTNEARTKGRYCGGTWYPAAGTLKWNDKLAEAADEHAQDMHDNDYFSHESNDGRSPWDRMEATGYPADCAGGENIADNSTPENTVAAWLESPGHCANIMNSGFKALGVGYAKSGPYSGYYVQNFGRC
ncbi:unnamed protein product [Rotaria magnacalcarata]|uniref:SCP domain-containing protein n=2 Tax=Rotaria magnacalcarata TaxID=392030 RepID=A0A816GKD8_9BILA|nr:unnamed protein product [Rotaria magnacalcarata]CAF2146463.1 unnamed protein product [Rotaria magnacalcarata]CAF3950313.1 unnamed protein product [Rotaria magnacalcarata]CAF4153607.1 unnamed protein product [Rotaria magnacalcarata]